MIDFYQKWISAPLKAIFGVSEGACRYHPTCSEYAKLSIRGSVLSKTRGVLLSAKRTISCSPLCDGGVHHASILYSPRTSAVLAPKTIDFDFILVPHSGKIYYILKALK